MTISKERVAFYVSFGTFFATNRANAILFAQVVKKSETGFATTTDITPHVGNTVGRWY